MTDLPYSRIAFDDVDHFREWSGQLGWALESRQLSRGQNLIRFDHFALPDLLVGHHHVKQVMHDVFHVPSGQVVFAICRAKLPTVWCGMNLPPSMLAILRPVRTYWVRLPAGWETYEFTVSEELIERTELFPPKFFKKTLRLEQAFLPLVEPQTGDFLRRMDFHFGMMRAANGVMADAVSGSELYDSVLHGLRQVIDAGLAAGPGEPLRRTRRADLVEQARDVMIANVRVNLTVDEIAQSLGVSYRVLNYAFQDALGVSPYQYFLTERLHAVRRELKTSDAGIAEVCEAHGFLTPSRFARQYKRLFGELPSETRNRKPV